MFTKEKSEKLLERIQAIYVEGRVDDPEVFKDDIRLNPQELETVVGYIANINLSDTDLDSKGRAFETFMGSFFRGEFGQYFTPRTVVDFIVNVLPIENKHFVLDPACGSSGFLLHILNKIRSQANRMYDSNDVKEYNDWYRFWHDFAQNNLYGIEINDQIARTAKMNMIIHDGGHTNVLANDGLQSIAAIKTHAQRNKSRGYLSFVPNKFDFITTNPPFGSTIKAKEKGYIGDYDLGMKNFDWIEAKLKNLKFKERDSQKSEILFIEQCYKFLEVGGYLAIVLPDGILTNSSLQYVRDWIEEHFRIVAVVSLPQTAFTHTGAGVKSSVLFAKKYSEKETEAIKALKANLQDELFKQDHYGKEIKRLFKEKAKVLKKGDAVIQESEESLINHLDALENQGTLDTATKRQLIKENNAKIKKYKTTDDYNDWRTEINNEYAEKINNLKGALQEEYLETVREKLTDYPIFMAIAEEIGYDATGRDTKTNELNRIGEELKKFINAVNEGKDSFFASALI